jgi:hypothetical protein
MLDNYRNGDFFEFILLYQLWRRAIRKKSIYRFKILKFANKFKSIIAQKRREPVDRPLRL